MVTKKATTKTAKPKAVKKVKSVKKAEEKKETKAVAASKDFSGKYFYAVGKRKTSIAQVRIYNVDKAEKSIVNGKETKKYFTIERHSEMVSAPLKAVGMESRFDISAKVNGGGIMGQAEAVRLGVARALILFDENLKKTLKDLGYLTRDARIVERKKPGRRKARRSPQWAKR
mgnify:CR=1 FL=1